MIVEKLTLTLLKHILQAKCKLVKLHNNWIWKHFPMCFFSFAKKNEKAHFLSHFLALLTGLCSAKYALLASPLCSTENYFRESVRTGAVYVVFHYIANAVIVHTYCALITAFIWTLFSGQKKGCNKYVILQPFYIVFSPQHGLLP